MRAVVAALTEELKGFPSETPFAKGVVGIGKVEAAIESYRFIEKHRPTHLIIVGICAAVNQQMRVGDIVVGSNVTQYDLNLQRFKLPRGVTIDNRADKVGSLSFVPLLEGITHYNKRALFHQVRVGSADLFLTSKERESDKWIEENLDVVDMESYSIALSAAKRGICTSFIKVVSDTYRGHRPKNFNEFLLKSSTDLYHLLFEREE